MGDDGHVGNVAVLHGDADLNGAVVAVGGAGIGAVGKGALSRGACGGGNAGGRGTLTCWSATGGQGQHQRAAEQETDDSVSSFQALFLLILAWQRSVQAATTHCS